MHALDETHDPALRSWVDSANAPGDFPIQNLPLGVFAPHGEAPRGGIAIGAMILDLAALRDAGLLGRAAQAACETAGGPSLNPLLALGAAPRRALRTAVSRLLAHGAPTRRHLLCRAEDCSLHLPAAIGDYTDFYAGIHHATNVGTLFRPEMPLTANYKHLPIGYHGRASSVRASGVPVRRPNGQRMRAEDAAPSYGPTAKLDYELELGIWVGAGNPPGQPIPIAGASAHIAGYCLLNDWSARDLQAWEYQPLGPFLGKSFHTTISPWIITPEALAPFRTRQPHRPDGDPQPLPYLWDADDQGGGALDITLEVRLLTQGLRDGGMVPHLLSAGTSLHLYWTPAQLLAHHASNGCDLRPGDLLGTGTISGPAAEGFGSLLEITRDGRTRIDLASGERRLFLQDGDEVALCGQARRAGYVPIGFGACRATIVPAVP